MRILVLTDQHGIYSPYSERIHTIAEHQAVYVLVSCIFRTGIIYRRIGCVLMHEHTHEVGAMGEAVINAEMGVGRICQFEDIQLLDIKVGVAFVVQFVVLIHYDRRIVAVVRVRECVYRRQVQIALYIAR